MDTINKKILQFFSCLSDETRLKILVSLTEKPRTVKDIHDSVGKITLSAVSHQLRLMSDLDIIVFEKKGRKKLFRLSDDFCWCILKDAFRHFEGKCKRCAQMGGKNGKRPNMRNGC